MWSTDDDLTSAIADALYAHRNVPNPEHQHYGDDEYECCARALTVVINLYVIKRTQRCLEHGMMTIDEAREVLRD